jgi:hypothetical protein
MKIFPKTPKAHSNSFKKKLQFNLFFSEKKFNIQEFIHHKSECHETKLMHPSSSRAFQRDQEQDPKHCGLVDLTLHQNIVFTIGHFRL